jgi:hypothetical protein
VGSYALGYYTIQGQDGIPDLNPGDTQSGASILWSGYTGNTTLGEQGISQGPAIGSGTWQACGYGPAFNDQGFNTGEISIMTLWLRIA